MDHCDSSCGFCAMRLVLASSSPRRKEILRKIGFTFEVFYPSVKESLNFSDLEESLKNLARRKAKQAKKYFPESLIISADTIVLFKGRVLGKPSGEKEAFETLRMLSGQWHEVISALCLILPEGKEKTGVEKSRVKFRSLSDEEIKSYLNSGEPFDKAGAYGIQGKASLFVEKIEGCYFNVVGFPLGLFVKLLLEAGLQDLLFSALRQKSR